MANNFLRSLGLVSAIAFIPAATAGLAQVDAELGPRDRPVHERARAGEGRICRSGQRRAADPRRHRRHAQQPRSAQLLSRRARLPEPDDDHRRQLWRPRPHRHHGGRRGQGDRRRPGHAGRPGRDQVGRLHHPYRRPPVLRRHARRGGRSDARPARHQRAHHRRPRRPRPAVRRQHHPRDHRHPGGALRGPRPGRHPHRHHLQPQHHRGDPAGDRRDGARSPAGRRSAMSSTFAPTPAACSTRRSASPTSSSSAARSSRSAAGGGPTSSASTRDRATPPRAAR